MAHSGDEALKSWQSFAVNDGLLAKVVEAVKAGDKTARTSGDIQSFEIFIRGFRQNIAIGRIYIVPPAIANDRKNFPIALLYGTIVRIFGGEEMADLIANKIGETEFDEYSKADFKNIQDGLFKNEEGKNVCLVIYAPAWLNQREYIAFHFTADDEKLSNLVRHLVFSAYFNPALSSAFDALMTDISTDKLDVTDITPKLSHPFLTENMLKDFPDLTKSASYTRKKKAFLTLQNANKLAMEILDPPEMDVFASLDKALTGAVKQAEDVAPDVAQAAKEITYSKGEIANSADPMKVVDAIEFKDKETVHKGKTAEVKAHECHDPKCAAGGRLHGCHDPNCPRRKQACGTEHRSGPNYGEEGTYTGETNKENATQSKETPDMKQSSMGTATEPEQVDAATYKCAPCQSDAHNQCIAGPTGEKCTCGCCPDGGVKLSSNTDKEPKVAPHEAPGINVGPGKVPAEKQEQGVKSMETQEAKQKSPIEGIPAGIEIDEKGLPVHCGDKEVLASKTAGCYQCSCDKAEGGDRCPKCGHYHRKEASVSKTAAEIRFPKKQQVWLWYANISGQISDGMWENSAPRDHWKAFHNVSVKEGPAGMEGVHPRRTYGFVNLMQYVGDEMLWIAKAAIAFPEAPATAARAFDALDSYTLNRLEAKSEDYLNNYVLDIKAATGIENLAEIKEKIEAVPYTPAMLRKDLREMQNIVNAPLKQFKASLMKMARDRDEHMEYKGHDLHLTTWEERDRLNINLTDETTGKEILNFWDDDARGMIEDGFLDPRKFMQSAIEYAEQMGLLNEIVEADDIDEGAQYEVHASMITASSQRSRKTASKHEEMLQKKYGDRRKFADEVPSSDDILNEVLDDIGQPPMVDLPGQPDQAPKAPESGANKPAETQVPAPMKSDKPEDAKDNVEPAAEQEEKALENDASKSAAVEPTAQDPKAERWYGYDHPKKDGMPADLQQALTSLEQVREMLESIDPSAGPGVRTVIPEVDEIHYKVDNLIGMIKQRRFAGSQIPKVKAIVANLLTAFGPKDPSWKTPLHRSTEKHSWEDEKCSKCGEKWSVQSADGKCPGPKKEKKADDQRKDDVSVVPEGKPSEDKKQPSSDLAKGAPEAHDVPVQVDKKVG